MNDRVLRVLEYNKMKDQLKKHAGSSLGRAEIEQMKPMSSVDDIKHAMKITEETHRVVRLKGQAPLGGIKDVFAHIKRAQIGGVLNAWELLEIADTIYAARRVKTFIDKMVEDGIELPGLDEIVSSITVLTDVERSIKQSVDDNGEVMDSATPTLRSIRQQIRGQQASIRSKLDQLTKSQDQQKKLSDSIVTIRNDRYVIPVKQEYRGSFGGIIHDQSASGATLFIEPQSVVSMNNVLREARGKEKIETEKILRELSAEIEENGEELLENTRTLGYVDFIFAKGYYAHDLKATEPNVNGEGHFRFKKARHPLIEAEEVVPITVELGGDFSSLVITGPNTGGKTVTLKTAGLLTLMAQSGLFLPVEENSEAGVFESIYADIGDEQSIEQNLSTFSSHMTNIVDILGKIDHQSLVLFDEIGAGTDPTEGAALAVSILDYVYNKGASLIATTHYSELKGYAYNREGVMNASVEFDVNTLRPTYRLLIGVPGRSNAFAISKRLGLSDEIITAAEAEISTDSQQMEQMIASLQDRQLSVEEQEKQATLLRKEAESLQKELAEKVQQVEEEKESIFQKAREEAESELTASKKQAEDIIRELRELEKQGYNVKEHQLIDAKSRMDKAQPAPTKRMKQIKRQAEKIDSIKPGDEVKVLSFGQKGQVLEQLNENEFQVQLGIMKMTVNKSNMEKLGSSKEKTPLRNVRSVTTSAPVKPELDLRGQRYEDALRQVEKYLDEAVLAGYGQVHIIHGKGTGALRKGVKEYLKKHPSVKSTRDGGMNEGGIGNTVAELK